MSNATIDEKQNEDINEIRKTFVSWKIFIWAISIILGLFTISFSYIGSVRTDLESNRIEYNKIQVQLSQIQTDLLWIKDKVK
jgi:hypothetical protein